MDHLWAPLYLLPCLHLYLLLDPSNGSVFPQAMFCGHSQQSWYPQLSHVLIRALRGYTHGYLSPYPHPHPPWVSTHHHGCGLHGGFTSSYPHPYPPWVSTHHDGYGYHDGLTKTDPWVYPLDPQYLLHLLLHFLLYFFTILFTILFITLFTTLFDTHSLHIYYTFWYTCLQGNRCYQAVYAPLLWW